jgi:hypothetical protein
MAQNTYPVFTLVPSIDFSTLTGNIAAAKSDGTGTIGTETFVCFTAGTNGSFVNRIRISGAATTPTTMAASVIRFYISSKTSGATTAVDTVLYQEVAVAAAAAANAANSVNYYEIQCDFALPPNYTILAQIHANVTANTRWQILAFGGDY